MARENFVLKTLQEKGEVTFKPHGNSMTPKIHSGDQVVVKKVPPGAIRTGDIVYAKVKGSYYLHLVTAVDNSYTHDHDTRFQISNNHGHVNGWASLHHVYGLCVQIKDKIIITEDEIAHRVWEWNSATGLLYLGQE